MPKSKYVTSSTSEGWDVTFKTATAVRKWRKFLSEIPWISLYSPFCLFTFDVVDIDKRRLNVAGNLYPSYVTKLIFKEINEDNFDRY